MDNSAQNIAFVHSLDIVYHCIYAIPNPDCTERVYNVPMVLCLVYSYNRLRENKTIPELLTQKLFAH